MTYFHTNSRQGAAVLCLRPQNLTQLSVEGAEWCPGPPAAAGVPLHSLLCTEHTGIHRFSVSCMPAFLAWHNKYKAFISTGFQTSADIVIAYMRSIVCWAAQCTSGALSAAVVAANFRDYISSTKMTTLLNSRAVFLSASSLLLLLPALLPSFLSFLSSLPTGSPRTSIIFPACSSAPHLTLLCMFSGGFSLFYAFLEIKHKLHFDFHQLSLDLSVYNLILMCKGRQCELEDVWASVQFILSKRLRTRAGEQNQSVLVVEINWCRALK